MSTPADPPLSPRANLRWPLLREIITRLRPATILEVGCGVGAVGVRLTRLAAYTAVEPDERSYHSAAERITPLGGTVLHGDHNKLPEGADYDVVCAFEVLEHIADDAAALAAWRPLIRPGGHLLLSVPADPERFGPSDVVAGHYRRYTAEQLRERLVEAGLTEVSVRHYGWPLGYLLDSVRDRLIQKRIATAAPTPEERSRTSGRLFQPRTAITGRLIRLATWPFVLLERARPGRGPGLIALATNPIRD